MKWFARFGVVFLCVGLVLVSIPELAGADWPLTPGVGSNAGYGTCNIQYDVDGPLSFGWIMAFNCNVAVPTGSSTSFGVIPSQCGHVDGGPFACSTSAPVLNSVAMPSKETGSACSDAQTTWFGLLSSTYYFACTSPVSPEAALTTAPPGVFTTSNHLMGFMNIASRSIGTASGGFTPESVKGSVAVTLDTHSGSVGPYNMPESAWLDNGGECAGFSSSNAQLFNGINADGGAAVFSYSTTASWGGGSYAYLNVSNYSCVVTASVAYPAAPAVSWGGGSGALPDGPCTLDAFTGNGSLDPAKAGTDYPYTFDYSGGVQEIVVDPGDGSTPTQTIDGKTFSQNANFVHMPPTTTPATVDVQMTAGTLIDPHLWCYDAGTWYDWGLAEDNYSTTITNGCYYQCTPSPFALCIDQAQGGMDLYNPVSWVAGIWDDGVCTVKLLFIPSSASMARLGDQFGITSNDPTVGVSSASQWLGNIGYLLTVGPSAGAAAIQTCVASGCSAPAITAGMSVTVSGHTYTASGPLALAAVAGSGGSWSTVLVDILAAALLVLFFVEIVRWIRRILGSKE